MKLLELEVKYLLGARVIFMTYAEDTDGWFSIINESTHPRIFKAFEEQVMCQEGDLAEELNGVVLVNLEDCPVLVSELIRSIFDLFAGNQCDDNQKTVLESLKDSFDF